MQRYFSLASTSTLPVLLIVLAPCLWGGNFVVGRMVGDEIPGMWLNLLRWIVAALVLAPFFLSRIWTSRQVILAHLPALSLLAALGLVGFNTLLYEGLKEAPVGAAALAFAATPFLVLLFDAALRRSMPDGWCLCCAILCLTGIGYGFRSSLADHSLSVGAFLFLGAAAASFAGYSVALKRFATSLPSGESFFAQILLCIPIQIGLTLLSAPEFEPLEMASHIWAAVIYVGVFAAAIAFVIWGEGVRQVRAEVSAAMLASVPVFAGVVGWLFIREETRPDEIMALAAVAIIAGAMGREGLRARV
jgi:drug/metabolite transporter (DMT)-like permease